MLSAEKIFNIATILLNNGYIPAESPNSLVKLFKWYSETKIDEIFKRTEITKNELYMFFNQTIPCLVNTTQNFSNTHNDAVVLKKIVEICFRKYTTTSNLICEHENIEAGIRGIMLIISIVFILILTFFCVKRKNCCLHCCGGFPGPVVPLNMIDSYENRAGFALAFCVIVSSCVSILFGNYQDIVGWNLANIISTYPGFISIFIKLSFAGFVSMLAYPLFVCQSMKNKLVGSVFGVFFSSAWLTLEGFKIFVLVSSCWKVYKNWGMGNYGLVGMFLDFPKQISLMLLLVKFLWTIMKVLIMKQCKDDQIRSKLFDDERNWRKEYMYVHVKNLMQRINPCNDEKEQTLKTKVTGKLKSKKYQYIPGFKYSTRIIVSTAVAVVSVYNIIVLTIMIGYFYLHKFWSSYFSTSAISFVSKYTGAPISEVKLYGICVKVSYWLSLPVATLFFIAITINSLTWYRRHIMRLRSGDRSFLPTSVDKGSLGANSLMVS